MGVVKVIDIKHTSSRIRGKVEKPAEGWVSIVDLDYGNRRMVEIPWPGVGDVVEILKTGHTQKKLCKLIGKQVQIAFDCQGEDLRYNIAGDEVPDEAKVSEFDCRVVRQSTRVITLHVNAEDGCSPSITCLNLAGDELAKFQACETLSHVRSKLASLLSVGDARVILILPDGRLMANGDCDDEPAGSLMGVKLEGGSRKKAPVAVTIGSQSSAEDIQSIIATVGRTVLAGALASV